MSDTSVLYLRLPPVLKEKLEEAVAGINAGRGLGDPELTINAFAVGCLATIVLGADGDKSPAHVKPSKRAKRSKK